NGVDLTKVMDIAEKKNLDVITSVDKYLDLLPKGVNKGSTLRKLINMLGVADERVLVAGDTMNDLAMFQIGCKGVVVGASEAALFDTTAKNQDVYHAKQPGAGGILEAMQRLDSFRKLFPANKTAKVKRKATKNQLVIVY